MDSGQRLGPAALGLVLIVLFEPPTRVEAHIGAYVSNPSD